MIGVTAYELPTRHDDQATKDPLGPDSQQAAGLSSHTDKTVEDNGIGEEGGGGVGSS